MDINELLKDVKSFNKEAAMKENMRMLALKDSVMTDAFNEANVKLASYLGSIKLDSPESNLTEFSRNKLSGKMKAILSVSTTAGLKRLPIHFVVKASVPYMVETPEQVVAALENVEGSLDKEVREILEKQKGLTDYHNEDIEVKADGLPGDKYKQVWFKKDGKSIWEPWGPIRDLNDFNRDFNDWVNDYFESEPDMRYCENWDEALEVLNTKGASARAGWFTLEDDGVDPNTTTASANSSIKVQAKKKEINLVNRENTAASQFPVKLLVYPKTYLPELKKGDVVNVGGFKYKYIGDEPLLNGDTENGINARFELMRTDKKASLNKKAVDDKKEDKPKKSEEDEDKEQRDKDFKDKLKFMQEEKHFEDLDPVELMSMVTTYRYYHMRLPKEALDAISQSADSASRYMSSFDSLDEAFEEATPKIIDKVVSSPKYLVGVLKNYSDDINFDTLPKQVKDKLMGDVVALVEVVNAAPSLLTEDVAEKIIKESPTEAETIYSTFGTIEDKGKGWDKIKEWAEEKKLDQAPTNEELGFVEEPYKQNPDSIDNSDYDSMGKEDEYIESQNPKKNEVLGPNKDDLKVEDEEDKKASADNTISKEAEATDFSTNLSKIKLDISSKYIANILREQGITVGQEGESYAINSVESDGALKWKFDFSGGTDGIEYFQINVPDQTIPVKVEYYTAEEYNNENGGEPTTADIQLPLSNVTVVAHTMNTMDGMTLYPESLEVNDNGGVEVSF